jgi:hypothetical protein
MQINYLNPYIYYYQSKIKPVQENPIQVSKKHRIVEPTEKGKFIDQYA